MQRQALTPQQGLLTDCFSGEAGEMRRWIRSPFENQMTKCTQYSHSVRRVADLEQYVHLLLLLGTWPVLSILCQLFNLQSYPTRHIPLLLPFPLREIEAQRGRSKVLAPGPSASRK